MPTNTAGTSAQKYHQKMVHYASIPIVFGDGAVVKPIVTVPAGALILRGGVCVTTLFNYGTNNRLDIGTVADDDGFATDLALGTVGVIVADEFATSNDFYVTVDTLINCTLDLTGTAGTTGAGWVWIEWILDPAYGP